MYTTYMENISSKRSVLIVSPDLPYSADPLEYDFLGHHIAFGSVFSTLVSLDNENKFVGLLSSEWNHSSDFKVWEFKIREGLKFSNGDKINPTAILKSLKRVMFLKKNTGSRSGLLEFVEGYDDLKSLDDNISGLYVSGDKLIIKFIESRKDVLERISFGFYSLVHEFNYDIKTGNWIEGKSPISSGPYEILNWNNEEFSLRLRSDFNPFSLKNRVEKITIKDLSFIKKNGDLENVDFVYGDSTTSKVSEKFKFYPNVFFEKIGYVYCYGWNKKESLFFDIENRKIAREHFYKSLEKKGFEVITNFLPGKISNNSINRRTDNLKSDIKLHKKIVTQKISIPVNLNPSISKTPAQIFKESIDEMISSLTLDPIYLELDENKKFSDFDLLIRGTDIDFETPDSDLRLMFLSKQGIGLPDLNGTIKTELNSSNIEYDKVNKLVWDQAIIWPLRHYKSGIWVNENAKLRFDKFVSNQLNFDYEWLNQ